MDTSVGLVQAYLHINGYFTVAEYQVLEAYRGSHARSVPDLDILAFRFARAGHDVIRGAGRHPLGGRRFVPGPILQCPTDRPDMIVGEVKEGAARFNQAMRAPVVLEIALARFGCCSDEHARELTRQLLSRGSVISPAGRPVRMIAFGATPDRDRHGTWTTIPNAAHRAVPSGLSSGALGHPAARADQRSRLGCAVPPREVGRRGARQPGTGRHPEGEDQWWRANAPRRMSDGASC